MVVVAGRLTPMAGLQLGQAAIYSSKLLWIFMPTEKQDMAHSSMQTQQLSFLESLSFSNGSLDLEKTLSELIKSRRK